MGFFNESKNTVEEQNALTKLQGLGVNMHDIVVKNMNGKTVISGSVPSEADMEKIKGAFGGMFASPSIALELEVEQSYTVKSGDALWAIAEKYYGDGSKHPIISEANGGKTTIHPGDVIKIPALRSYISGQKLQVMLSSLGYNVGAIDGVVGAKTVDALKNFQQKQNISPSGKLDASTRSALRKEFKGGAKQLGGQALQVVLKELGHNPGALDGVVGAKTQEAIRSFQQKAGIGATGSLDDSTIAQLATHFC